MRRFKVGGLLLLIAAGLVWLAMWMGGTDWTHAGTVRGVLYAVAGAVGLVATGLMFFGTIALTPWFVIDLKSEVPALRMGPRFFRVVLGSTPLAGSFKVPGTRLFLFVPFLLRFVIKAGLAYLVFLLVRQHTTWLYSVISAGAGFLLLSFLDHRIKRVSKAEAKAGAR